MAVTIEATFQGFPGIVQGGYLGGLLARQLDGAVEVTFRAPAKTDVPLELARDGATVTARDGENVLAQATATTLELDVPEPVDVATAEVASRDCPGNHWHPFASCFCCGPKRGEDGLRIFPGPVAGRELMAAPWTPNPRYANADGTVPLEITWAALDCPAIYSLVLRIVRGAPEKVVSGRIAVKQLAEVRAGEPHVVLAWPIGNEGRKLFCGAALVTATGTPLVVMRQTCIVTEQGVPLGKWGLKAA